MPERLGRIDFARQQQTQLCASRSHLERGKRHHQTSTTEGSRYHPLWLLPSICLRGAGFPPDLVAYEPSLIDWRATLAPQLWRQFHAETRFEQFHVPEIFLRRNISVCVAQYLNFWGETTNSDPVYCTPA